MNWGCDGRLVAVASLLLLLHLSNLVTGEWDTIGKAYCVHVGQRPWGHYSTNQHRQYSIGGHRFFPDGETTLRLYIAYENRNTLYANEMAKLDGYEKMTCQQGAWLPAEKPENISEIGTDHICANDKRLQVRLYQVQQGGKTLRGWLHVEVEFNDTSDELQYVYVQFLDEQFYAVGEFVSAPEDQCRTSVAENLIMPFKYQYLPCHAMGHREPKVSSAVFVVRKSALARAYKNANASILQHDPNLELQDSLSRGIHVTWRLGEYSCSQHKRIRIETLVFTKKSMDVLRKYLENGYIWRHHILNEDTCGKLMKYCRGLRHIADYWLAPDQSKWTGTPDIKIPTSSLTCSSPVIAADGKVDEKAQNWLKKDPVPNTFETDFEYKHTKINEVGLTCQEDIQRKHASQVMNTFSGRCGKPGTEFSSKDKVQMCKPISDSSGNQEKHSDYATKLHTDRLTVCKPVSCVIPEPNDETQIGMIQGSAPFKRPDISQKKISVRFSVLVEARKNDRWDSLAQTRKYHANLCIFVALFLIPVSNFMARYYKETHLCGNQSVICPPWFVFHLTGWFFALCMIRSGYTAMRGPMDVWGKSTSEASWFHYVFGYIFIILYTLMGLLGIIRPVNRGARVVCMGLHSGIGLFLNWASLALVVQSSWIPASPSIDECDKETGETEGLSTVGIIGLTWGLMDLGFHIGLSVIQLMMDRKEEVNRHALWMFFPPLFSRFTPFEFTGAWLRKILLPIYVGLSLFLTLYAMGYLLGKETKRDCTLGNMTCDLEVNNFGCSPIAMKYNGIVKNKYNITK